jgi:2-oxoglutarate ferredoxin oxidoreductase subunit gamma
MGRNEIRIAGAGGQGVVTAGRILAEAAILSGSEATHSQVYGPQSRGGASRSDVVIATESIGFESIGFPLADRIDLLVVLSAEAYARYEPELGSDGTLIVDTRCAPDSLNGHVATFPVVDTARAVSGGQLVTGNMNLDALAQGMRIAGGTSS